VTRGDVADTSPMTSTELLALPRRALRRDHVVFAGAMAMGTAHLLDDGLLHPHTGSADVPGAVASVAIATVAVALYGRLGTWARAVLAGLFGLAGLAGGLDMHACTRSSTARAGATTPASATPPPDSSC